jgi:hypothetical protein
MASALDLAISSPVASTTPDRKRLSALLLSRDLIFISKIQGTAADLGHQVLVSGTSALAEMHLAATAPRVVFVDLTAGDLVAPSAIGRYRKQAVHGTWFVAFGPHVEGELLVAAKNAGCQVVLTRSRFVGELSVIIRRYLEGPAAELS